MALLKPRLRLDSTAALPPSSFVQAAGLDEPPHSHVSSFRSLLLEMHIYSPLVRMVRQLGTESIVSRPVFGDHNRVEGKVMLDPSCGPNGRLSISIEGAFEYSSSRAEVDDEFPRPPKMAKHRHVFLSSSAIIPISPSSEPRSALREAFGVRKRPSATNLNAAASRSCEFSFEIPRGNRPGEEMPPTFSSTTIVDSDQTRRSFMEKADVTYRVTAVWESMDPSESSAILEAPILFQPDVDFQSLDGSSIEPESWLEMPLKWERPIPFQCHVTLPMPHTFSRCSSIPYYVVFTTTPRSSTLAREIAADATIAVSLVRKITINPQRSTLPPTPPETPPPSDEDTASPITPSGSRSKLLKRAAKSFPQSKVRAPRTPDEPFAAAVKYKPLPQLPTESFSESRIIQTQICIGFPKRPRSRRNGTSSSTPEPQPNLPDGLYKGKIQLSKDMLPGVDWPGVSVKYYLDVSVLFGQDDVRARIPIRLF
ncbi:hypothetical protein BV22DRAFT_1106086 [Leucogyrophana mollusca]|uniref:Uncharacterized protein n=1 Tax=Leucogyrophana mollusca TaxID=85980 RepID=A0ACB8BCB0_9AGAM|nr:hypothetical protein BV22DRAFT_1106086 [Leucogyrophana mollusca]